jgi:hypothetical protein
MTDTTAIQEIFDALAAPFPIECVSWRVGPTNEKSRKMDDPLRGQPLCYIDARTVMDRLDSVVGFDGWQNTYTPGVATSIVCNIGIRVAGDWIWKSDGAGATDMEADKGTLSDAFKRAAVRWGVGRYLYDLKAPWLVLEKRGNTAFIRNEDHAKLAQLHDEFARKAGWGEESGIPAYRLLFAELSGLPPMAAASFGQRHRALIEKMPPAMRKHFVAHLMKKIEAKGEAA